MPKTPKFVKIRQNSRFSPRKLEIQMLRINQISLELKSTPRPTLSNIINPRTKNPQPGQTNKQTDKQTDGIYCAARKFLGRLLRTALGLCPARAVQKHLSEHSIWLEDDAGDAGDLLESVPIWLLRSPSCLAWSITPRNHFLIRQA